MVCVGVVIVIETKPFILYNKWRHFSQAKQTMSKRLWIAVILIGLELVECCPAVAQGDLRSVDVLQAIERGRRFLIMNQNADGSWTSEGMLDNSSHQSGVTALAVLALCTSGMTARDPAVQRGLRYLRSLRDTPDQTYDVALMIMALVAAKDAAFSDLPQITALAHKLASGQITRGNVGAWSYTPQGGGGDPSNSQYAILGLREAAEVGVRIPREVWQRAEFYWTNLQNPDGGWAYSGGGSTGSMTVAGVASLAIVQHMLKTDEGVSDDGMPPCCQPEPSIPALERGLRWLAQNFAAGHNPGAHTWLFYYLYGVERAGRLTGRRFFGDHDWYREGTAFLLKRQNVVSGSWVGEGIFENRPIVGTSLALLFLAKGLSPVMMSKLQHGPRQMARHLEISGNDWNHHPRDVRNLMEHISGLPRWPSLLTAQEVDLLKAAQTGGVSVLLQSPMMFITGEKALMLSAVERDLLREYILQGGFVLAVPSCNSPEFEASFRDLARQLFPAEGELRLLPADHPVFRSEYLLSPDGLEIYGAEIGCRTSIMYVPEDLGCLWSYWQRYDPPNRNPKLKARIVRALQIGVNIAAYATGREPPASLDTPMLEPRERVDPIERGLLQIVQIRHTGQWNAAPRALRNLLLALNHTVGPLASLQPKEFPLSEPQIFRYPLLYMHGRTRFSLSQLERTQLRQHLLRGGVLFADACCGATAFDQSFRDMVQQVFPEYPLQQIPITHELFSDKIGRDIRKLRRRINVANRPDAPLASDVREVEPLLEGVEIDGRYVIIYSKYDISCALERQSSLSCEGYVSEDAVKLAMNIVLYAMLQDVSLPPPEKSP
ncbi:MAG: hypothetical protein KatS3mg114_0433 [Planctomycetaceae bacterium]|nr:MAG: hypothetical protein KatS3mg114_0433 [Planctomycetaceae bacterium]